MLAGEEIKGQEVIKWRRVIDLGATSASMSSSVGTREQGGANAAGSRNAGTRPSAAKKRVNAAAGAVAAAAPLGGVGDPCDWPCAAGQLLRIHPYPKRFPACHVADWAQRLLGADDDYVVINKPAGLPSMRHESNGVEHAAACAAHALGMGPLQVRACMPHCSGKCMCFACRLQAGSSPATCTSALPSPSLLCFGTIHPGWLWHCLGTGTSIVSATAQQWCALTSHCARRLRPASHPTAHSPRPHSLLPGVPPPRHRHQRRPCHGPPQPSSGTFQPRPAQRRRCGKNVPRAHARACGAGAAAALHV